MNADAPTTKAAEATSAEGDPTTTKAEDETAGPEVKAKDPVRLNSATCIFFVQGGSGGMRCLPEGRAAVAATTNLGNKTSTCSEFKAASKETSGTTKSGGEAARPAAESRKKTS